MHQVGLTDYEARAPSSDHLRRKLFGLQYLRAIAALAVVVYHSAKKSGFDLTIGEAGVDLFFVLSGYLMIAITDDRSRPQPFLRARIERIVPTYWLATTVMLAGAVAHLFPNVVLTPSYVLSSYLFIPTYSPNGLLWPLLTPGWTLNYEMFFYAVFAAAMLMRSQRRVLMMITVLFVTLVLAGLAWRPTGAVAATYTDPLLLEFAAGAWLGLLWKAERPWPSWLGWPSLLAGLALLVAIGTGLSEEMVAQQRSFRFGIAAVIVVASLLAMERRSPIAQYRLPLFLGDASYSIYLWHALAISVSAKFCALLGFGSAATILLGVIFGTAVGAAGYLWFERPVQQFFAERRRRARAVSV